MIPAFVLLSFEAVVLIRCSTRLITASASWRHFLIPPVVPGWMNSCASQSQLSVSFGFQQLFNGLSKTLQIQTYRQGKLLCSPSREKKNSAPSLAPRGNFDWKLAQFRRNASAETPYLLKFGRQVSFCARFQWPMTGSFEVYVSEKYSRVVKIYYKKKLCGQTISENNQVTSVDSFSYWKQLQ